MGMVTEVSTTELRERIGDPACKIIDVRSPDAYNGWRLRNESRGGHIASALSLPSKWIDYMDWLDIVRSKEIAPSNSLILYGCDAGETEKVARHFGRAGYENVRTYHGLLEEWCPDEKLPMDRLKRYRQLVPAGWVHSLINSGTAPEYENNRYVICHAHYRNRGAYEEGHIPGAVEVDTNTLESPETWNRRSPGELKAALEKKGITSDTTVILYGRFSFPRNEDPFPGSSAGQLGAMRCAFIMMYAGVKDVRVLNGGLQSWVDAGYEVTREDSPEEPVDDFGATIPGRPELAVDLPEAKRILDSPDANLVSVRSWREYIGEVSGYNYIEKKGRIPGSVFGNCGSDAYHMENYRNVDHTMREYPEIEHMWSRTGITAEKQNAFYCGTGWRGSEAFFDAWLLGWPRVAVFDGGWFEWSSDERNPCESGDPAGVGVS